MSTTLEEKLARPVSVGGRARATLEQLEKRHGFRRVSEPIIKITCMGETETWDWVSGAGLKSVWEKR